MAKHKERMQDIALGQFSKVARRHQHERLPDNRTLAQQLDESSKLENLDIHQRIKNLSFEEWLLKFKEMMRSDDIVRKYHISNDCIGWVIGKFKTELKKFHSDGELFAEVAKWVDSKQGEHMNR